MTHAPADLILRGGTVVDGRGGPPQRADVAIARRRIAAVGDLSDAPGPSRDVTGLVVAPGFIDMHTHSDLSLLINPNAESAIRQGVTTQVIGMCGFSPAPSPDEQRGLVRGLFTGFSEAVDWEWDWMGEYLEALRNRGPSTNVVPVVGHATLRALCVGLNHRPAQPPELRHLQRLTREAMEEGAVGLSSGLVYSPSMYADTEELIALAKVVAELGGIYFTHIRGECETLFDALAEAIRIGQEAGCPVHVAHLKCDGRQQWGQAGAVLELLESARERGVDITYDSYPYTAWNTSLGQLLPNWAREGGSEALVRRLSDPDARARIREYLVQSAAEEPGRWERRLISSVNSDANRTVQGRTLAEIAEIRGTDPEEVILDLLTEEHAAVGLVGFGMDEQDVTAFVCHPLGMIGSDSASSAPYGRLGMDHPHPRTYGSFARVLGHYVREEVALPLETAVAKMSRLPAERLGLTDRGVIAPGKLADLVVFDPATIADRATYQQPHLYAAGVRLVFVNGILEVDGDSHHAAKAGRVLARGA